MSLRSGIARVIDQAKWKTPDHLIVKREAQALHDQAHGQTLPVFMGAVPIEGIVFWRVGPTVTTTTHTDTDYTEELVPHTFWSIGKYWTEYRAERTYTTTTTTERRTFASFAVAHSFNQFQRAGEVLKVEFDDIVVYDALEGIALPTGITMRVYDGINNGFDPAMLAKDGAALTPAYHGVRYLFFDEIDLAGFDGAIPASIRILWGDAVEASETSGVIPLLAITAEGYSQNANTRLAYDGDLDRFVNYYDHSSDADAVFLGVTDFATKSEVSLVQLTGLPDPDINNVFAACMIPGTGLMLTASSSASPGNWDLLVDVSTGVVEASFDDGSAEVVHWWAAEPFTVGGAASRYIAAGFVWASAAPQTMPVSFLAVNVAGGTLQQLEHGTSSVGTSGADFAAITPGYSKSTGTTFYVASGSKVFEALFTSLAAPVWREVYDAGQKVTGLLYDSGSDALIISTRSGTTNDARSIDQATGTVEWTVALPDGPDALRGYSVMAGGGAWGTASERYNSTVTTHRLQAGYALLRRTGSNTEGLLLIAVSNGALTELAQVESVDAHHFDHSACQTSYALFTDEWRYVASCVSSAGTVTLAEELVTFSKYDDDRGGLLTDAQVTTEGLAGIVNGGVIIDTDTDLRELASRIAELWGVVKVETATGVKWLLKGKDGSYAADVMLTEADLAEERRGEALVKIATRHRNPKEIPAEIEVRYISSNADYEAMPARAAWPQGVFDTALSILKRSLSVPVVLTDQQALELAWGLLGRERAADRIHSLKLRPYRLKLEPSDVFEITAGGQSITGMFTKQTKMPDHSFEMVAEGYLSRAATVVVAESPIVHERPPVSTETLHVFLDGPLLDFDHDSGGSYLVGYSVLTGPEGWLGGSVWRRRPGAAEWVRVGERAGSHPVVGTLTAPLPASPWPFETDTENELTFSVDYGDAAEIAAQTEGQFYEAASILAVGAPGRWNFLTWLNVTDNGDGTLTLDTIRQGLRGTEVYEGTSLAADRVVLLQANQPMEIPYDLADYGETVGIKAPAIEVPLGAVAAASYTVSGTADTPRAPGNLDAEISGSDVELTWDRCSRLEVDSTGTFGDGTEAPLGADLDVYLVEILDGPGGMVLRGYPDVAGEAKTYAAADITADFGAIPDNLTFRVSQKTSITGIGYGHQAVRSVALQ